MQLLDLGGHQRNGGISVENQIYFLFQCTLGGNELLTFFFPYLFTHHFSIYSMQGVALVMYIYNYQHNEKGHRKSICSASFLSLTEYLDYYAKLQPLRQERLQ